MSNLEISNAAGALVVLVRNQIAVHLDCSEIEVIDMFENEYKKGLTVGYSGKMLQLFWNLNAAEVTLARFRAELLNSKIVSQNQ